jgi:hypothetical protein
MAINENTLMPETMRWNPIIKGKPSKKEGSNCRKPQSESNWHADDNTCCKQAH